MLKYNFLSYSGKIILQFLGEILYFPIWWYSVGFIRLVKNLWHFLLNQAKILAFSVWLKNLFVPMYGQRDFVGRFISFVIRLAQIILRGFVLFLYLILILGLLLLWLAFPIALLLMTAFQFT